MKSVTKRLVEVATSFRGLHYWATCNTNEVQFLAKEHRHTFHVTVTVEVGHGDRAVEFFMLQRDVGEVIQGLYRQAGVVYVLGSRSCEMIAEEIGTKLLQQDYSVAQIKVSEDNENAGVVVWE